MINTEKLNNKENDEYKCYLEIKKYIEEDDQLHTYVK